MHRCRSAKYFMLLLAIISIKHCEFVSLFLPQLPSMKITNLLRRIVLPTMVCLALSYFSTLSHKRQDFGLEHKICCNFLTTCLQHFSFWGEFSEIIIIIIIIIIVVAALNRSYNVPALRFRYEWNLNFFWQIFEKYSNIKFHENPSSGSRVVLCGREKGENCALLILDPWRWHDRLPRNVGKKLPVLAA